MFLSSISSASLNCVQATQNQEVSCIRQVSSQALRLLQSPFSLMYYSGKWVYATASYYLFGYGLGSQAPSKSFYAREDLKGVWERTEKIIKKGMFDDDRLTLAIKKPGKTSRQSPFWRYTDMVPFKGYSTTFQVVNQDAVYSAIDLKKEYKKVALLNPANAYTPGGGARTGAAAMEEDLCRRSALLPELEKHSYPLNSSTVLYTADVPFFRYGRDRHYSFMVEQPTISIITSAAIDLNPAHHVGKKYLQNPKAFEDETRKRIYAQLWKAATEENEAVVLTAFGCGAFRNDPEVVAKIYKDVLDKHFQGVFKNVTFAIIDDHNAKQAHNPKGNFLPFSEIFG